MKSFDVFDTLVGRWYIDDDDFKADGDFEKEVIHTFPILENRVKLEADSFIVSDTYFSKEQVERILSSNGIRNYGGLMVSYDDKWTGKTWKTFKPDHHLGDNKNSDFDMPTRHGVRATHYTGSQLTPVENFLIQSGYKHLAGLARAVRLSNPYELGDRHLLWNEQSQINIPLLVIVSNYLASLTQYDKLLFSMRDCCNLELIFKIMYPNIKSEPFFTSRDLYSNPTEKFRQYISEVVTSNSLVVDLQGTAKSCKSLLPSTEYFTVVYSDLDNTHNVGRLVHRKDGFSDKIERLNYDVMTKSTDVAKIDGIWYTINAGWITMDYRNLVSAQRLANGKAREFLRLGFDVERHFSQDVIVYLLRQLESNCVASQLINHEVI